MENTNLPMDSPDVPANVPEVTKESPEKVLEKRDRAAKCLVCSNEWIAHNGNNKKPSRCPSCKSRNVVWKDEGNTGKTQVKPSRSNEVPDLPTDNPEHSNVDSTEEITLEKIRDGFPRIPMQAVIILVAGACVAAVIVFLARQRKEIRKARIREIQMQQIPQPTGTAAAILRQKGIIGGY